VNQIAGAQDAHLAVAGAGSLVGQFLGNVQAGKREIRSRLLESDVRGVVRTDKEVGTRACQPLHADGQRGADRGVVSRIPGGQAMPECDVVERHVRVHVRTQSADTLLAELEEAQRSSFGTVRENAEVFHDRSMATVVDARSASRRPVLAGAADWRANSMSRCCREEAWRLRASSYQMAMRPKRPNWYAPSTPARRCTTMRCGRMYSAPPTHRLG